MMSSLIRYSVAELSQIGLNVTNLTILKVLQEQQKAHTLRKLNDGKNDGSASAWADTGLTIINGTAIAKETTTMVDHL